MKHVRALSRPQRAMQKELGFLDVLDSVVSLILVTLEYGFNALLTYVEFKTQDNGTPQA